MSTDRRPEEEFGIWEHRIAVAIVVGGATLFSYTRPLWSIVGRVVS